MTTDAIFPEIEIQQREQDNGVFVSLNSIVRISDAKGTMYRAYQYRRFLITKPNELSKEIGTQIGHFIRDAYYMLTVGIGNPDLIDEFGQPIHVKDEDQRSEHERIKSILS